MSSLLQALIVLQTPAYTNYKRMALNFDHQLGWQMGVRVRALHHCSRTGLSLVLPGHPWQIQESRWIECIHKNMTKHMEAKVKAVEPRTLQMKHVNTPNQGTNKCRIRLPMIAIWRCKTYNKRSPKYAGNQVTRKIAQNIMHMAIGASLEHTYTQNHLLLAKL